MVELGELERRHQDFDQRNVRIFAISQDPLEDARLNQSDFPHLQLISDADQKMAKAVGMVHPGAGPHGTDTNAPTTLLVDGTGTVRWLKRPSNFFGRIPLDEELAAIDANLQ
jgi:peroxiredoxin